MNGNDQFFEKFSKATLHQPKKREPCKILSGAEISSAAEIDSELQCALTNTPSEMTTEEFQLLFAEVLYTIKHKVGQTAGGHTSIKQDLFRYCTEAFDIPVHVQDRIRAEASEAKPPIVILNLTILEARNLEAKDSDGFSDPYCMAGVIVGDMDMSPQTTEMGNNGHNNRFFGDQESGRVSGSSSPGGFRNSGGKGPPEVKSNSPNPLRKFGQSIRRRVGGGGSAKPSGAAIKEAVIPAKYIQTTSVKENTLNPVWNEKFRFDLDDVNKDKLHLDIWDHDDESNVFDAVGRLNEIKGVRGLGRYFKQVGQSARKSSGADVDDFLGSFTIALKDIPSTGAEGWYRLEGRTARSKVQGEIRLRLSLATREDRGISEEDNLTDVRQHTHLIAVFIAHELKKFKDQPHRWPGKLSDEAETILHQHAIQGDITSVQLTMCRWIAFSQVHTKVGLNYGILVTLLERLDTLWHPGSLSRVELGHLGDAFKEFNEYSFHLIQQFKKAFPENKQESLLRLGQVLRCLATIHQMELFRYSNPFASGFHSHLMKIIKTWAEQYYATVIAAHQINCTKKPEIASVLELVRDLNDCLISLQKSYNPVFEENTNMGCFYLAYRRFNKLIKKNVFDSGILSNLYVVCSPTSESSPNDVINIFVNYFQLFSALQEFFNFRSTFTEKDKENLALHDCHSWFRPVLDCWVPFSKKKLIERIDAVVEVDQIKRPEGNSACTPSATQTVSYINILVEVWRRLHWPDIPGRLPYITTLMQMLSECAVHYTSELYEKTRLAGYYDEKGQFDIAEQTVCFVLNNMDHVDRTLSLLPDHLGFERVAEEVAKASGEEEVGEMVLASLNLLHKEARNSLIEVINKILQRLAAKMRPEIRKNVFHLCWSPDSVPVEEAVGDLVTYLDGNFATLRRHLLQTTFCRVLESLWSECLSQFMEQANKEIADQGEAGMESQSQLIFVRLHQSLDILYSFFNGKDEGLTKDQLETEEYQKVKYFLEMQIASTHEVVERYFLEKLRQQETTKENHYGSLSIRVFYKRETSVLAVEVISAKSLTPLDSNGLSDPFVIVELVPPHHFLHVKSKRTKTVKNTLDPMFNEHFDFQVSIDQLKQKGAALCFIVMDHDMLSTDDFEGEVFVPLINVPGIKSEITAYGALKTLSLPIIQPKYQGNKKEDQALFVLSQRVNDSYAQEIVKKWMSLEKQAADQQSLF